MAKTKTLTQQHAVPMKPTGFIAELADQPQLVATSVGTLAVGLLTRQPALIRGGARMMLAVAARAAAGAAVRHAVERGRAAAARPAPTNGHIADLVAGAIVGLVAEAIVSVAFDRATTSDHASSYDGNRTLTASA